jgi:Mo-co oxidoreductase dimerisation domain
VRALITSPIDGEELATGELAVRGVAWSGSAPIARVEVSVEGGGWQPARLLGEGRLHSWQRFELVTHVLRPGPFGIRARASDLAGYTQPEVPEWNRHGYANNAVREVRAVAS